MRRALLLATCAGLGGVLGWLAVTRAPQMFDASATLLVTPPPDPGGVLGMPALRALFSHQEIAADVVRVLQLDQPPTGLTPHAFLTNALTVEDVPDTHLVRVKVRLPDGALAAQATVRFAEGVVERAKQLAREHTEHRHGELEQQIGHVRRSLEHAEQQLLAFHRQAGIELLRREVDAILDRRDEAQKVAIEIESERARLRALEAELHRHPADARRALPLQRNADEQEGGGFRSATSHGAPHLVYPVEDRVLETRITLAALEETMRRLTNPRPVDRERALGELYQKTIELAGLEADVQIHRDLYTSLATRYEQSRMALAAAPEPLRLFDVPSAEGHPVGRSVRRAVVLGIVAALLLAASVVVARDLREPPASHVPPSDPAWASSPVRAPGSPDSTGVREGYP